jgi:hypothetical protein
MLCCIIPMSRRVGHMNACKSFHKLIACFNLFCEDIFIPQCSGEGLSKTMILNPLLAKRNNLYFLCMLLLFLVIIKSENTKYFI